MNRRLCSQNLVVTGLLDMKAITIQCESILLYSLTLQNNSLQARDRTCLEGMREAL